MSTLTHAEVSRYLLAHGCLFDALCDDCKEKLIAVGEMRVVLKWKKRTDGLTFLGAIPDKVRCMSCNEKYMPKKEETFSKKITSAEVSAHALHPIVQKTALSIIKHNEIPRAELLLQLRKKKVIRELKKSEITNTVKGLRKLKVIRVKNGIWIVSTKRKSKESK